MIIGEISMSGMSKMKPAPDEDPYMIGNVHQPNSKDSYTDTHYKDSLSKVG